ncbi:hypothetical protein MATL_G00189430 [Megalops atlanticus]|uniref:Centrosomal protein of 68 kDa n=1 Tax=Megalops atlanticus TaxID=7932 RepID=A0A9D3PNA6_MEGAT|nr:hypothetical protein MATL_G00189430 [Megalops atlanticus]
MALGVDRTFPELFSQMEPKDYGRWKTRIPGYTRKSQSGYRSGVPIPKERAQSTAGLHAKDQDKEKTGHKKTVTMAPTSKYLTGKSQYIMRKPLFATDSQTSILKKPQPQEHSERETQPEESCSKIDLHQDAERQSRSPAEETQDSFSVRPADTSSLSASGENLTAPLTTSDLRSWSPRDKSIFTPRSPANRSSRRSLSSPPLDVHRLTVQVEPRWTSSQRSSSLEAYSSSYYSKRSRAKAKLVQSRDAPANPRSFLSDSKCRPPAFHQMSPYQANYWACAIPSTLPPSPDRKSPSWDPDKEYQALLDYTYPLRPNHLSALDSTDTRSLLRTDPLLDSGIELDRFCSSSNLSCTDHPLNGRRWRGLGMGLKAVEEQSLALKELSHSKPLDRRLSGSWHSSVDQIGLSVESLLDTDGKQGQRWTHYQKQGVPLSSDTGRSFIPTSRVLPARGIPLDLDEEFYPLPGQLQELQVLSEHLRAISIQVSKPVDGSWESLEKETCSVGSSTTLAENKSAEGPVVEEGEEPVSEAPCSSELSAEVRSLEASLQRLGSEVNRSNLRRVASFMGNLSGVSLSEFHRRTPTDQEDTESKESLMYHIQTFCSNLEELILWLYTVVEKLESLAPPTADIESVKASLADYKSFQREVTARQPLTAAVLHTGEILLRSMNSTSPVLKDTLAQIERQSRALEAHAEHLFSSILSAMDSLTEPSSTEAEEQVTEPSVKHQDLNESGFMEQE